MAFGLGIPALFVNLSVAAWIKFYKSPIAAALTVVVLGVSLLAMAFFVRKWTSHILDSKEVDLVSSLLSGCNPRKCGPRRVRHASNACMLNASLLMDCPVYRFLR
jgi:hypothetical protein